MEEAEKVVKVEVMNRVVEGIGGKQVMEVATELLVEI